MMKADPARNKPPAWFIPAVIRWRIAVLAVWAAVIATAGGIYLSQFRIDHSVAIWFLEDDPELDSYRAHNAAFGEREWTYVWLRGDSVFAPEFLRDLDLLGRRIASLENVTRVVSLTEASGMAPGPDGLPVFRKLHSAAAGELPDAQEAERLEETIRGSPMFVGRLVPRDNDHFTILAVQHANRIHAIEPYRIRLIDGIRDAIASCPAMRESGIVGTTVVNSELNRAARRDMLVYYSLIAAFVLVGGGLALGSLRDLAVLMAVVVGTVLPVLGAIGALQLPFNLLLAMAAAGRLPGAEEFLSGDGKVLRLRVMTGAMGTRDINAFRAALDGLAQPDGWDVTLTGTTVLWANMDAHVVRTQLLTVGITAAVLLILLPLAFRSLSLGLLGFAVSFVPVLCTLGLMAWIGLPVNIATCILGGVVMGLAVDDTIYYISSFKNGLRHGASAAEAARRATITTGRAMIKTSLVLTGGFLTMAASDFLPSVYFGLFFAFSILTALLADLIVLPILLRWLQPGCGSCPPGGPADHRSGAGPSPSPTAATPKLPTPAGGCDLPISPWLRRRRPMEVP